MINGISVPAEQRTRLLEGLLVLVGASAVASLILVPEAGLLVVIGCAALWFIAVVCDVFEGKVEGLVLCWAAFFPLGYLIFLFPPVHPIITAQRLVVLSAFTGLFFAKPNMLLAIPRPLRRAALICLAFIAVAAVSLTKSPEVLGPGGKLFDSFFLPILFGWSIIARFDARRRLPLLHAAVCISSIICAAIAAAEMVTGEDLLPYDGSAMFYAGGIPRPNGPFGSNDALAMVGALSFFFLLFFRAALSTSLGAGRRMLHTIGVAAALGMALMPMFRSIVITLLLALIIDAFCEKRTTRRAWHVVLILAFLGLIFSVSVFAPDMFADRSDSQNVYARVAQYEQSLRVFVDHPLLGVGFASFNAFVAGQLQYRTSYEGWSSVDWPHNNLMAALAETGILGFVTYVMTHIVLLWAMWQLRQLSSCGYSVWRYYVYMFLTYWITGLTEATGFNAFVNLWYVFLMTICYKYVLTAPDAILPVEERVPGRILSAPA